MALDVHETDQALRDLPDTELANRGGRLERLLASFPAEVKAAELRAIELAGQAEHIQGAERRLQAWRAKRDRLGVLDRKARAEIDERISRDEEVLANNRAAHSELATEVAAGQIPEEQWLEAHGVELAQATVVERELAARCDRALQDAVARAAYEPSEDLLERIGQRPDSLLDAEQWDRAAAALEAFRQRYAELPGPDRPPARDHEQARAWEHATAKATAVGPEPLEAVEPSDLGPEIGLDW